MYKYTDLTISTKENSYEKKLLEKGGFSTENCDDVVSDYYNLATDFYRVGWGESFHFANRSSIETFNESILRHEYYLALQLGITPGMKVMDLGCGIGGPLTNIAMFTKADISGITCNQYQINIANQKINNLCLGDKCRVIKGNYLDLPFPEGSIDRGYEIEAFAHCTDLPAMFRGIARVLKPNGEFAGYFWATTEKYNPENPDHKSAMDQIVFGNGLPCVYSKQELLDAIAQVPELELIEEYDLAESFEKYPWYHSLQSVTFNWESWSLLLLSFFFLFIRIAANVGELFWLAPKGTKRANEVLIQAGIGLYYGGKQQIYTPMYFYHVRKKIV